MSPLVSSVVAPQSEKLYSLLEDAPDLLFSQVSVPLLKHFQLESDVSCVPFPISHVTASGIGHTGATWAELGRLVPQKETQWTEDRWMLGNEKKLDKYPPHHS